MVDIATEVNDRGERAASPLREMVKAIASANRKTLTGLIEDKRFDDRELQEEPKVSKKNKKRNGENKNPRWDEMEIFSGLTQSSSITDVVEEITRKVVEKLYGGGKNAPTKPVQGGNNSNKNILSTETT